ncbi:11966_t:CDS:2 [Ambispora gerdemannii]|uniref:11966_t:CDS:1 n=1 Tax=Ambispora gerdemannii TaxID=144530 RepID=A0A9N8WJ59_9GLOM|nr:11966_t:CDS:2 [Ambispora gerdemannii]
MYTKRRKIDDVSSFKSNAQNPIDVNDINGIKNHSNRIDTNNHHHDTQNHTIDNNQSKSESLAFSLPTEIFKEIFANFDNNYQTLLACALVNRQWCKNAVPILWRVPFKKPGSASSSTKVFEMFVRCLSPKARARLIAEGIDELPKPEYQPTFRYLNFLACLDFQLLWETTHEWLVRRPKGIVSMDAHIVRVAHLSREICTCIFRSSECLEQLVVSMDSSQLSRVPEANFVFTFFPGAVNCLPGIKELQVCGDYCLPILCKTLSQICQQLVTLRIDAPPETSSSLSQEETSINLIRAQKNLKHFQLYGHNKSTLSLLLTPISTCAHSLESLKFQNINFTSISRKAISSLCSCVNLIALEITKCRSISSLDLFEIAQKFTKLLYFSFNPYPSSIPEEFAKSILTTSQQIEFFSLKYSIQINEITRLSNLIFQAIIAYGSKLLFLELPILDETQITQILLTCPRLEEFLFWVPDSPTRVDQHLRNLGNMSPPSLKHICINGLKSIQFEVDSLIAFLDSDTRKSQKHRLTTIIMHDYENLELAAIFKQYGVNDKYPEDRIARKFIIIIMTQFL